MSPVSSDKVKSVGVWLDYNDGEPESVAARMGESTGRLLRDNPAHAVALLVGVGVQFRKAFGAQQHCFLSARALQV